jgi:uncharacterized protein
MERRSDMKRQLAVWVVAAFLAGGIQLFPGQETDPAGAGIDFIGRAGEMVGHFFAGDDMSAGRHFDETMNKAAPPEMLKMIREGLAKQVGEFKETAGARMERNGGYVLIYIACVFEKATLDARVVFNADGDIAGLNFVPHLESTEYRTPAYARTDAFRETEVEVGHGEWVLPGTLAMPLGQGSFPAVILVHGSGPNDRDETIGPNRPFKDLAWGLASRGIAVLRYDKRTKVHRQKIVMNPDLASRLTVFEETVEDALAAAALLRRTDGIDPSRVYILGHSLGGMLIPRIAAADKQTAGFIILAGLTRPLPETMLQQTRYILALRGTISEEEKAHLAEMEKQISRINALDPAKDIPGERIMNAFPAYWLDLRGYDPPAEIINDVRPLFILQGGRDYQVTKKDFENWKKDLEEREKTAFKLYPKCNHLFMEGEGLSTPNEYLYTAGHVAEDVIADIADWIAGIQKSSRPISRSAR